MCMCMCTAYSMCIFIFKFMHVCRLSFVVCCLLFVVGVGVGDYLPSTIHSLILAHTHIHHNHKPSVRGGGRSSRSGLLMLIPQSAALTAAPVKTTSSLQTRCRLLLQSAALTPC